jgi:hypothetical protein
MNHHFGLILLLFLTFCGGCAVEMNPPLYTHPSNPFSPQPPVYDNYVGEPSYVVPRWDSYECCGYQSYAFAPYSGWYFSYRTYPRYHGYYRGYHGGNRWYGGGRHHHKHRHRHHH